ncbi:POT family protein [Xylaria nigripes]|nr:POT family protein [Xylaria nigripes]
MDERALPTNSVDDVIEPINSADVDIEKGQDGQNVVGMQVMDSQALSQASSSRMLHLERYPPPTEEERATLRRVHDSIPWAAWSLCFVELSERASYYGVIAVFNNYLQFPLPEGGNGTGAIDSSQPNSHAGALNLGLQTASAVVLLYRIFAFIVPIFGAWLADAKIGRYPAIVYGVLIGGVAHIIMSTIGGAAPVLLKAGKGVAPFLVSLFLLAFGAGIFKPNVVPTLIDQYEYQREYTKVLKSGEKVLVDPEISVSHILHIFYSFVNLGAFFSIAIVYVEKYCGFWLAYLMPGIVYFLLPVLLIVIYKRTIRKKPVDSDLVHFVKITTAALQKSKGNIFSKNLWHNVTPSVLAENGIIVKYSEENLSETIRTWGAIQDFLYLPMVILTINGPGSLLSNQGASMTSNGAPSDLLAHFNALIIIVVSPLMAYVVYPFLLRRGIKIDRSNRMAIGFFIASLSGAVGAIVQYRIYETSPCRYQASTCGEVSPVSIWWQLLGVGMGAIAEVFVYVTAYEHAHAQAPENMKSTVISAYLSMVAVASALGELMVPFMRDPTLIWAWTAPAAALFIQTIVFVWRHQSAKPDEKADDATGKSMDIAKGE